MWVWPACRESLGLPFLLFGREGAICFPPFQSQCGIPIKLPALGDRRPMTRRVAARPPVRSARLRLFFFASEAEPTRIVENAENFEIAKRAVTKVDGSGNDPQV